MKALFKMKAGPGGVVLRQVEEPIPASGEIKVKIHAAGICGTDIHIMKDEYESNFPVIMGHEYSGIVCETGKDVKEFKIGDRVISLTAVVTCGNCRYCNEGLLMLCEQRKSIGSGVNGAFAEYMVVPARLAFKIPKKISMDEAALCEPLACVTRGVIEKSQVKAGDYVLVSGPGTIGLLTLQVAAASGGRVIVTGTSADRERLRLAMELGAYGTITVDEEDAERRALELTDGWAFDVAFECAGVALSANTCLRLLKKTGLYAQVGLYGKKIEFDHDLALKKEISITNNFATKRTSWDRALRLLAFRQVNVSALISAKLPLEKWEEGFRMSMSKEGYKVLLMPNE